MKQLKKYDGKNVELEFNTGLKLKGVLYKYYRTTKCKDGDYEYWLEDTQTGAMELIHPSNVKNVVEK